MIHTDPIAAAPAFVAALAAAERVLLLTHTSPDGDAIGSLLGLYHALRDSGKQPIALASSPPPAYCAGLPAFEQVQVYRPGDALPDADLVWLVDTATLDRIGVVWDEHSAALMTRPLVVVDHHVTNSGGGSLHLIQPGAASCAELLFRLLQAMKLPVSAQAATCLLLGMTTDTQSFQTSSTKSATLRAAADLLEAGADQRQIIEEIYYSVPASTLRLTGRALSELHCEDGLVWTAVPQALMRATGAADEAVDDTVTRIQRVAGMRVAVLFKERRDGTVKISLRSAPGIDVAAIAKRFGGGGHTQAAGATLQMDLAEAEATILPLLRALIGKK